MGERIHANYNTATEKHPVCPSAESYWQDYLVDRLLEGNNPVGVKYAIATPNIPVRRADGNAIEKANGNRTLLVCKGDYAGYLAFRLAQTHYVEAAIRNGYLDQYLISELNAKQVQAVALRPFNPVNLNFTDLGDLMTFLRENNAWETAALEVERAIERKRDMEKHAGIELFVDLAEITGVKIDRRKFVQNAGY